MDQATTRSGVLLVNLGTPRSPSSRDVRRYLREFLSDPRVLDIPALPRFLLVNAVIAPFRAPRSAEAYRAVWTKRGSPLLSNGQDLRAAVAAELGADFEVALGMRYGEPSLPRALDELLRHDLARILVVPLFPQYASSSTGSALARIHGLVAERWNVPALETLPEFFDEPGFIAALAEIAKPRLDAFRPDHVLFSYHGLPERQVRKSDTSGRHCLASASCCDAIGAANRHCYRAQCYATSRALAAALALRPEGCSTSFQSRLGRTPWITPHTDAALPELARAGVARLAVLCPSFVADCLETLEEIGLRGAAQWRSLGGEALELVPCANAHPAFVRYVASRVRGASR
ncbi:MAG: ferrochelatase [Deltaproteobacteria bacterium]|nr:ferrochelatase [Deltaproteobacteria bacterium]